MVKCIFKIEKHTCKLSLLDEQEEINTVQAQREDSNMEL